MNKAIDPCKLLTVRSYALREGVAQVTVYKWIEQERVDFIIIDGVKFIKVK